MALRKGIVVAVHHEDHSVDLVMADDGARLIGVPVLAGPGASARTGRVDLPDVPEKPNKWDITKRDGQDMEVLVDTMGRYPVVMGFLYPQISQMLPKKAGTRIDRHRSDVVQVLDAEGNMQLSWPDGLYIRIGDQPDSVPVANANSDSNAAIDRNTGSRKTIRIETGGNTFQLTITPDGQVTMLMDQDLTVHTKANAAVTIDGDATLQVGGNVSATVGGTLDAEAGGAATVKAPSVKLDTPETTLTGNLTVQGSTSVQAITSRGKNISSTHVHLNSGGPGPGGVPA